jgi:hypothetical protein
MDHRFVTRLSCKFIQAIRLSISSSIARDLYKFSPPLLISQLHVSSSNLMQPSSLGRRSCTDALQEGSRKKPSVTCFLTIIVAHCLAGQPQIHSYIQAVTSGVPYMHFAMSECSSRTDLTVLEIILTLHCCQRSIYLSLFHSPPSQPRHARERREDRIFQEMLKVCHGLGDRLVDASTEEIELIADLARRIQSTPCIHSDHAPLSDSKGRKRLPC